jgi:peptidoglycan/LPS O-acetylase OafA/YrhL
LKTEVPKRHTTGFARECLVISQIVAIKIMSSFALRNSASKPGVVLDGVQYLRGLCAVIVVVSHCNGIIGKPEYYSRMVMPDWHIASVFAVAAFFSISGFIIVIASLDRTGTPRTSRSEYVRRRFVRIVPFLWLCTIGYNLLSWAGTGQFDGWSAARTMVVWPLGELKPNVAWSLRHELLFYVIYAAALLGPSRRIALLLGWFTLSAVFYVISYDLDLLAQATDRPWFEAVKVLMGGDHGANFQFAVGMGLACLYLLRPGSLPIGRIPPATMIALTAAAGLIVTRWPLATGLPDALLWTALSVPVLGSAICARPAQGWIGRSGLVLGNASFAIYLVHNPVVLVLLAIAAKAHLLLARPGELAAFLLLCIVAAVGAGIAAHYWVEAPLIRACERWTRRSGAQPARVLVD